MAQLTDRLPLTDGTNKVYDIPASPSALGAVAGFATDALKGYENLRQDMAETSRQRRIEEEKRRKADATYAAVKGYNEAVDLSNASNEQISTAQATSQQALASPDQLSAPAVDLPSQDGVFTVTAVAPEAVTKNATRAGRDITNVMAAIDQGRMPAISLKAALNGKFNQLIDQHPDQAEQILDIWKKMGIDTTLFREGKDLGDQLDEDRESRQRGDEDQRKFQQHMFEVGAEALGETIATGGANGGAMSRDEVIAHGLVVSRQGHDMQMQLQAINLQTQQTALTREQKTDLEKDRNNVIAQHLNTALYNGSTPVVNMVQNLANSILKEPNPAKQAEQWQAVGTRLHAMFENQITHAIQLAYAGGYTGNETELRTSLTNQFKRAEDLFTGQFSVAQAHLQALSTIQSKLKIDGAAALPVYTALHDLGMDPNTMTGFINGISENSDLAKALSNEIKGFSTDFGKDRASEHLMQIVHILRGESTLSYMAPSEARSKLPDLYNTTRALATNYARGIGGDPSMVLNGVGELSIAANSLTPSSGSTAHMLATVGTLGKNEIVALKKMTTEKGLDPAMVTATIQAARASGAHVLNNFQANIGKLNEASPYFKIKWNDRSGQFVVDSSLQRKALAEGKTSLQSVGTSSVGAPVYQYRANPPDRMPKDMEQWVQSANQSLEGLIALRDFDPSTPKGTDLELRRYYGQNIEPDSLKNNGRNINPNVEIEKQFNAIESVIDKNLTVGNIPVKQREQYNVDTSKPFRDNVQTIMQSEGTAQTKGFDTILGDAANGVNRLGVTPPKPPTQMTLGEAFDFGNNILRPASGSLNSSAMGGLQITATNIRDYGKKLFGADWKNVAFTPENQIKLAEAIHADQGYGAWEGLKK
jgi:hypothetical protein